VRVLIDYRPALRQRTGVGEYAHELATALTPLRAEGGSSVTLFSSSWKDRLAPGLVPGARQVDRRVPVSLLNRAWHRWEWPPIESLAGRIDVAHSMHPLLIPARGAAQVVTIHDLYFLDWPESTQAEIKRDYPSLTPSHARRADAVIVVSNYTAREVRARLDVQAERIRVCPAGAPAWKPRDLSSAGLSQPGPILFVGTIEPRKNVGALLAAYRKLLALMPDAPPLVLAGGVSPDSAALMAELEEPPLAGRAKHIGYVTDSERPDLYRSASVLVLPSLNEGFGLPVLEAMTVGLPVVAANRGALPELLDGAGMLIEPADTDGLARAIHGLLCDPARAHASADRGLLRARDFTWQATARRVVDAYSAAIERRAARASTTR
jgi:glycosyltransferase involved in cell wall biosynthesis